MSKVQYKGREIDFDAAANLMDDDLREMLHDMGYDDNQSFFDAYCEAHEVKFGQPFSVD